VEDEEEIEEVSVEEDEVEEDLAEVEDDIEEVVLARLHEVLGEVGTDIGRDNI
jgi:tetrahydromethanopterin S-methyltransferase subunit G